MKKKMNDKGFSLAELIVVIAIMGILAVTLAPRLTQYVDKARVAADEDTVNTLLSSAKIISTENPLPAGQSYRLTGTGEFFTTSDGGKTWEVNAAYVDSAGATIKPFFTDLKNLLPGKIQFKSSKAGAKTNMLLTTSDTGAITIYLDYNILDAEANNKDNYTGDGEVYIIGE